MELNVGARAEGGSWEAFPADLLAEVLQKLPHSDAQSISSVSQTCSAWRNGVHLRQQTLKPKLLQHHLASAFPNLQTLDLQTSSYQPWQLMWLVPLTGLKSLSLHLSEARDAVDELEELPNLALTSLKLSGSSGRLREAFLELRRCTTLRKLDLSACDLSMPAGSLLDVLWGVTQLEHLAFPQQWPRDDQCCQVDDKLCDALGRMPNLAHLDLRQPSHMTERGLDRLAGLERLRTLRLGPCAALLDCGFQAIACHLRLTALDLCFGGKGPFKSVPGELLVQIASLPDLASLQLGGFDTSHLQEVPSLRRLSNLTHLGLSQVTDVRVNGGLQKLLRSMPLQGLMMLELSSCAIATDAIRLIAQATGLRALSLSECPNICGSDLHNMTGLSKLESLILDHSHVLASHNSEWSFLRQLSGLTQLSWAAPGHFALPMARDQGITGLLEHATALKRLQRLDLRGHIMGAELGCIAALTALTYLDISARGCNEVAHPFKAADFNLGLAQLAGLNSLQRLNLANTAVCQEGIRCLCRGAKELVHLDLSGTAVADAALAHLAALPRLQSMCISNQPALDDISDAGLAEVSRISALRCLEVNGNHSISAAGLKHLSALTGLCHLDVSNCSSINPKRALRSLQGCMALRELRLGSAHSVCHADPCRDPPRVREANVAAFRARMPFLHTLTLAPHHVVQDVPSKAVVSAAMVTLEECMAWLALKWLSFRGGTQKLVKALRTTM